MGETADTGHDRRRFIVGASAATAVAAAGGFGGYWLLTADDAPVYRERTTAEIDHGLLSPLTGDRVTMTGSAGAFAAYMAEVTEVSAYRAADGTTGTAFSVLIESEEQLGEGTYQFDHAGIGTFPMFVAPIGLPAPGAYTYEAVFNRLD